MYIKWVYLTFAVKYLVVYGNGRVVSLVVGWLVLIPRQVDVVEHLNDWRRRIYVDTSGRRFHVLARGSDCLHSQVVYL